MPSLARDDVVSKAADLAEVGESSQPDDMQPTRQPEHQQIMNDRSAALTVNGPANGTIGSAGRVRPLPQARPARDTYDDDLSNGDASGTSSVSVPIQIQSSGIKTSYSRSSFDTGTRRPSDGSNSLRAHSLTRADSTDSTKRPPPRALDITRSVRNGAPTSPMPLYSEQLFDEQQLCCPSPVDSNSEGDFVEQAFVPDISQTLTLMKRKRPHPKEEEIRPSIADPIIVAATRDIIALLQIYGPLSYIQLKVNIETQFKGEVSTVLVERLQKVLDILVELEVICILESGAPSLIHTSESTAPGVSITNVTNNNPFYAIGSGVRRMDSILPSNSLEIISEAGEEIRQTQQRIEMLQSFITAEKSVAKSKVENEKRPSAIGSNLTPHTQEFAKAALRQMMEQHPNIAHDPTYAAALRLFKVYDVSQNNKSGSVNIGSSSKKGKRPSPNDSSAVDTIAESKVGNESPLIDSKRSNSRLDETV